VNAARWTARAAAAALLLGACAAPPAAPPAASPEPAWIELFDGRTLGGFVPTLFGGEGEVEVRSGAIELGMGSPLTGVTWTGELPHGDYELEVRAARTLGNDFFCGLTFPAGGGHLTLVLGGWGGAVCGLSCLDGLDAANNETRTLRAFATGRSHTVTVTVAGAAVAAAIDGAPLCRADLRGRALSLRPEVLRSAPLGIASFLTAARIEAVRWRPLGAGGAAR